MPSQVSSLLDWFNASIVGSQIWAAIGLGAAILIALYLLWKAVTLLASLLRTAQTSLASRKRRSTQGFGIAVAPIVGPSGGQQTKAIMAALDAHLGLFVFGTPVETVRAPRMRAKGAKGLRSAATQYLEKSSTDLVLWGLRPRGKDEPSQVEILSCGGSRAPSEAMHLEGYFPQITPSNVDTTSRVAAYFVARALQPGLSDGSAFKAEKLAPVADILLACLDDSASLPDRTMLTLESDYCSMALHLGGKQHLTRVAEFRRKRLSSDESLIPEQEIQARIDLGRALLGLADASFDPVQVREAMDHLKVAVELLKSDPILQLAQATNRAVQQGQAMLSNRKRFSVTDGSNI